MVGTSFYVELAVDNKLIWGSIQNNCPRSWGLPSRSRWTKWKINYWQCVAKLSADGAILRGLFICKGIEQKYAWWYALVKTKFKYCNNWGQLFLYQSVLLFISIFVIKVIKIALNSLCKISCWFTAILIMSLRNRSAWKREQTERICSRQEINRPAEM